jgi:hypothetical protein
MNTRHDHNIEATTPLAMHAVCSHMLFYDLPAPASIDAPVPCMDRGVRVGVSARSVDAWLETIVVDDETTKPASQPGYVHTIYAGRLPTGIRVEIITTRRVPELHAVTA